MDLISLTRNLPVLTEILSRSLGEQHRIRLRGRLSPPDVRNKRADAVDGGHNPLVLSANFLAKERFNRAIPVRAKNFVGCGGEFQRTIVDSIPQFYVVHS